MIEEVITMHLVVIGSIHGTKPSHQPEHILCSYDTSLLAASHCPFSVLSRLLWLCPLAAHVASSIRLPMIGI
jgi:hypothetical protein